MIAEACAAPVHVANRFSRLTGLLAAVPTRLPARLPTLLLTLSCTLVLSLPAAQAQVLTPSLRVQHWWQSNSERIASDTLGTEVRKAGIGWVDEYSGNGVGASILLRSRILARAIPDIAQGNSIASHHWSQLGLVSDLDALAAADNWKGRLLPAVDRLIRPSGHVVAVPLGIHRINTLFYNRALFARLGISPPQSWDELDRVAAKLQRAGIVPLAQSSEPWQIAILFEILVIADGGVPLHRRLFGQADERAYADPRLAVVLQHLRHLKTWMRQPVPELGWMEVTGQLVDGSAAMLVAGDWVKGELAAAGADVDQRFGCVGAPSTASVHVYDIDTLAMLRSRQAPRQAQEKVAQIAMRPELQERYNRIKGSVSVLKSANLAAMDSCARASWTLFASPDTELVPSMAIGMADEEELRDALIGELHRFFTDDAITVEDTQRRMAAASRAFTRTRLP